MDEATRIALLGIGAPGAIGLALGLCALRAAQPPGAGRHSAGEMLAWLDRPVRVGFLAASAAAIAIGLGWYIAQLAVKGAARWPPVSSEDRLRIAAFALGAMGLLGALFVRGPRERFAPVWGAILAATGLAIVFWPRLAGESSWPIPTRVGVVIGFAAWAALAAWPLTDMLQRGQRVSSCVILTIVALATGAALLGTGSAERGWIGLGAGASIAGLSIVVVLRRGAAIGGSGVALAAGIMATMLALGRMYGSTPTWVCVLLALAPVSAWAAGMFAGRRLGGLGAAVLRIGVAGAIASVAAAPGLIALARSGLV